MEESILEAASGHVSTQEARDTETPLSTSALQLAGLLETLCVEVLAASV